MRSEPLTTHAVRRFPSNIMKLARKGDLWNFYRSKGYDAEKSSREFQAAIKASTVNMRPPVHEWSLVAIFRMRPFDNLRPMQFYLECVVRKGWGMKSRRWRWFWLLAVVAGSALIPPILFGQPRVTNEVIGGDPWRNTIFDFQTLLTGLAAVAAASWTVYTMERTVVRQERRHRELVSLAIRADRLRADRAVNPQLDDFENYVDENIAQLKHIFGSDESAINQFDAGTRDYLDLGVRIETFSDALDSRRPAISLTARWHIRSHASATQYRK